MIYLDNAATTFPKPPCVAQAMRCCMCCYAANPGRSGHALSMQAASALYDVREALATFFGADAQRVVFTMNCTEAINLALKGCLKKGDHVIVSSLEHNAVYRPLYRLQQEGLISFDVAAVEPRDDAQTVSNFEKLIRDNTKMIFCTHVSNVFGAELPIKALSKLAKARGLLFGLDAAQSAGTYPIHMERDAIDLLCVPGHKGLLGPMGTGALLLREGVEPRSLTEGGTGSLSLQPEQPQMLPDRLESGTRNLPGLVGLRAGIRFLNSCGNGFIHAKEAALVRVLREDMSVIQGVEVFGHMQKDDAALLAFRFQGTPSEDTAQALNDCGFAVRAGYHCAALAHEAAQTTDFGVVRVSPGPFSTMRQIKSFTFYVNQIAKRGKLC